MALSCWSVRLGLTLCVIYVFVFRDDSPRRSPGGASSDKCHFPSTAAAAETRHANAAAYVAATESVAAARRAHSGMAYSAVRAASGKGHCLLKFEMPPVKLCKVCLLYTSPSPRD